MPMTPSKIIWLKEITCPLCLEEFQVENVWQNKVSVKEEYPDLGKRYQGTNPLYYSVWVCPYCLYAELRGDEFFDIKQIDQDQFDREIKLRKLIAKGPEFHEPRIFDSALKSYQLAVIIARSKGSSKARLGTLNLRLAWLYRSVRKTELEKKYVKFSLDLYLDAYQSEGEADFGALSEGGITYLLGELYRQTGDLNNAVKFFQRVVNDKEMFTEPKYIKLARHQWQSIKEMPEFKEKSGEEAGSES